MRLSSWSDFLKDDRRQEAGLLPDLERVQMTLTTESSSQYTWHSLMASASRVRHNLSPAI